MLSLTPAAADALATFQRAASRFDPDVRVRLVRDGSILRPELAHRPEPGDQTLEVEGVTVFAQAALAGVVDAGEHNELTIRDD